MKLACYQKIIEAYRQLKKRDCLVELSALFPDITYKTLESIVFQECQRKTKKHYYFHATAQKQKIYYERLIELSKEDWSQNSALLNIADEMDVCPALMARFVLEHYCKIRDLNYSKARDPEKSKFKVNDMLKDSSLIEDPFLAANIRMCILADQMYGPVSDCVRNCIGQEYEAKLKNELTRLNILFADEKQLRERGYDKTPDVKLDIPIAVDSQVINWIESKASFGDVERHNEYLRDQYWSYCNRFGPGLVIYWAGYIDELNVNKEQGIMISNEFPAEITYMCPAALVKDRSTSNFSER